jgi:hypothetical protein
MKWLKKLPGCWILDSLFDILSFTAASSVLFFFFLELCLLLPPQLH